MPLRLPQPTTHTETYLAAILDEIQGLRADLAARSEPVTLTVQGEPQVAQAVITQMSDVEPVDLESHTVPELKAIADDYGIEYPANIRKADLIALLEQV